MSCRKWSPHVVVLLGLLLNARPLWAGERDEDEPRKPVETKQSAKGKFKPVEIDGQLAQTDPPDAKSNHPCKLHRVTLRKGKLYTIDLVSKDFDTYLKLEDAEGKTLAEDDDGGEGLNSRIKYTPLKDGDYQLVATTFNGQVGNYRLTVRENDKAAPFKAGKVIELGENGLSMGGKLTADDPQSPVTPTNPCKLYSVKMKANETYVIDLVSNEFDAYLHVLEDKTMRSLAADDDSGGGLNARIEFRPIEGGTYHILATTLNRQLGAFTLSVRTSKD